jgi:hypothetical protein
VEEDPVTPPATFKPVPVPRFKVPAPVKVLTIALKVPIEKLAPEAIERGYPPVVPMEGRPVEDPNARVPPFIFVPPL